MWIWPRWAVLRDAWGSCYVVFRGSETVLDWTENSGLLEMVSFVLDNLWLFQFQLGTISRISPLSRQFGYDLWLGHFWGESHDVERCLVDGDQTLKFLKKTCHVLGSCQWNKDDNLLTTETFICSLHRSLKKMMDGPPSAMCFTFSKAICPFGASLCLHGKDRPVKSRREWEVLFRSSHVQLGDMAIQL